MRGLIAFATLLLVTFAGGAHAETPAEAAQRAFLANDLVDRSMVVSYRTCLELLKKAEPLAREAFIHRDWETLGNLRFLEALEDGFDGSDKAAPRHNYKNTFVKVLHKLILEGDPQVRAGMIEWIANRDFSIAVEARDVFRRVTRPEDIEVLAAGFSRLREVFPSGRALELIGDYHAGMEASLAFCRKADWLYALNHSNPDIFEVAEIAGNYRQDPEFYTHVAKVFARGDLKSVSHAYDLLEGRADDREIYELALKGLNSPNPKIVKETLNFLRAFPQEFALYRLATSFAECDAALTGPRKIN